MLATQVNYGFLGVFYMVAYGVLAFVLGLVLGWAGPRGWLATFLLTASLLVAAWAVQVHFNIERDGAAAVLILAAPAFPLGYWLTSGRRARDRASTARTA
jgi:hypothetical protein